MFESRSRAEKSVAVEVNQVIRHFGYPDFRLPRDLFQVFTEFSEIWESADINAARAISGKHFLQFYNSFRRHRPVRSDNLDQEQPLAFFIVQRNIRQLVMISD